MTICCPPRRNKIEYAMSTHDLGFSFAILFGLSRSICRTKIGQTYTIELYRTILILSYICVSLIEDGRQFVLVQKRINRWEFWTPWLVYFQGKRSPYSPLIVSSTNLHLTTTNGLGLFWRTRSLVIFSFFFSTIFSFLTCFCIVMELFHMCNM